MVCHSLSYYWKDTRLKVYIWQPFEARIIETWRPNSETPGLQFKYRVPTGVEVLSQLKIFDLFQKSESETFKIFNLYTPQLAAGSESERNYLLLFKVKSSEISNENVSCGHKHTQDGQHGHACQHPAAAVREIGGELDLIFTFSGMQVTTIEIPFCSPFFQLSRPH